MNNRTSFALLAFMTAVGTLTMSSAYAAGEIPEACVGCSMEDAKDNSKQNVAKRPSSICLDRQSRLWT